MYLNYYNLFINFNNFILIIKVLIMINLIY
jgi:hypothetical protein